MLGGILNRGRDRKRRVENHKSYAEDWNEDNTKFKSLLVLRASTWEPFTLFKLSETTTPLAKDRHAKGKASPTGKFTYVHQVLPAGEMLDLAQGQRRGKVRFDGDVVLPALLEGDRIWMSYTPFEILTQRQGLRRSSGTVLMGGLGMGWLLRKAASKKSVKKIILVEIEQELMDFYGTDMVAKIQEEQDVEIEVHVDDVWNHVGKHGEDVRHVLDIWPSYPSILTRKQAEIVGGVSHFWGWGVRL
jgi:hypothetical protein